MQIKRIPIVLDLQNKGQPILIPAKQADTGRTLEFKICNGAEAVEIKNNPVLSVKKASGKKILNACSAENGNVLVKLTNQILAETGRQKAELVFKNNDGTVKSFAFWLDVEETTYDPDAIMSQNEFDALDKWAQEVDDRVEEVIKRANQQYEEMKKQAALIGDGNVGTVTGPRVDSESLDSAAVVKEIPGKTVQVGTPDPEHPVPIQGVGDSGYFDGVLLQGYYSIVDGTLVGASDYICNENKIPCNSGDEISITVKKDGIEDFQFLFYEKNGTYIGNAPNWTAKAPEGTAFVCFRMKKTGLTTRNAGHIAITINGKYMTMIKSRTANLFDYRRLPSKTQGGATVTNNGDGSFTISGSGNINGDYPNNYKISHDEIIKRFKAGKLFAKSEKVTAPYFFVNLNKDKTYVKTLVELSNKNYYTADILQEYLDDSSYSVVIGINGNKNQLIKPGTIKPMLYQDGDGTYQPYKESSSMIPITQPLYAGDKVYQKDGELWLHWENAEVTFDGSEDENWVLYNGQFYTTKDDMKKSNSYVDNLFCDRFQTDTNNSAKNDNTITGHWDSTLYPDRNWIYITKTDVESVSALKTWLQSNPVTVVYKLAVPVEERITAEEAYNLRTYAPYSTIWTPDDLDPEFLVDTAKNLAGSYALESYAQAKKNEMIKDNGSEMNLLTQKIEKIEELMKNALMISE